MYRIGIKRDENELLESIANKCGLRMPLKKWN
jgi:hypothetical protein